MAFLGKPQATIVKNDTNGEYVAIECQVYGYPASNITWSIRDENGALKAAKEFSTVSVKCKLDIALNHTISK